MTYWLYSANVKFYDVFSAFKEEDVVWPINTKVEVGDTVYIYLSSPHKKIGFITTVKRINLPNDEIRLRTSPYIKNSVNGKSTDKAFMLLGDIKSLFSSASESLSFENLRLNGLSGMLMGPRKLDNNPELLQYIKDCCT